MNPLEFNVLHSIKANVRNRTDERNVGIISDFAMNSNAKYVNKT